MVEKNGLLTISYPQLTYPGEKIKFPRYKEIFSGNIVTEQVEREYFEEPMLLIGLPLNSNGYPDYGLLIFTPVSGINETVNHVKLLMLYSSIFAIILAMLVAYTWSRSLSNPLQRISGFAEELSSGNFGKTVNLTEIGTTREINELADSINHMSLTLEETIGDLLEERNKLKYVLAGMEEGVLAVNSNKEIILINDYARELLTIDKNRKGEKFSRVIRSRDIVKMYEKVFTDKKNYREEFSIEKEGITIRILIHLTPIYIGENNFWGVVGLFQNISERWRFEQLQKEFIANVSHDLKTPLSSIKGASELLLDKIVVSSEKHDNYLRMIIEESDRLERLVEDILKLEEFTNKTLTAQKQENIKRKTNVNKLLEDVYIMFDKIITEENIHLQKEIPDEILYVNVNKEKIKQVLFNLLDNACKFTPDNGDIELGAVKENGKIKFWVRDQGIGIPENELENIWERFYKVDKARTPGEKGSGLGLAIVKQIVESMGGEVFVKSNSGYGSIFGFYLDEVEVNN